MSADVLAGVTATKVTRQLVALAERGSLRPHLDPSGTYHGLYLVLLNAPGQDGLFGALHVSARNGNVVRANLCHGNWSEERTYTKVADIRRVLKSWAALQCNARRSA